MRNQVESETEHKNHDHLHFAYGWQTVAFEKTVGATRLKKWFDEVLTFSNPTIADRFLLEWNKSDDEEVLEVTAFSHDVTVEALVALYNDYRNTLDEAAKKVKKNKNLT